MTNLRVGSGPRLGELLLSAWEAFLAPGSTADAPGIQWSLENLGELLAAAKGGRGVHSRAGFGSNSFTGG